MTRTETPADELGKQDWIWIVGIAVLLTAVVWLTNVRYGTLIRGDFAVFFVPFFEFLGTQLRSGSIPAWNPHQFAGAPFVGDPGSGWGYVPAMASFLVPNLVAAVALFIWFHVLLGGVATFVLARLLGLNRVGSLVAAVGYASVWLIDRSSCCPAWSGVAAWLPVLLIGIELASRRSRWSDRLPGWIVAGFALTQIATSWMGQGLYYVLLLTAAYSLFRAISFPVPLRSGWERLVDAVMLATVPALIGAVLGAFALIPMLDVNGRTTLARGQYDVAVSAIVFERPLALREVWERLTSSSLQGQWWYAGAAFMVMAVASVIFAKGWRWSWFFLGTIAVAIILATASDSALFTTVFRLLPGFAELHGHQPSRALMLVYLPLALLAGATVDQLARRPFGGSVLLIGGVFLAIIASIAVARSLSLAGINPDQLRAVLSGFAAFILLLQIAAVPLAMRPLAIASLVIVLIWDPLGPRFLGDPAIVSRTNAPPISLAEMARPPAAARWLREQSLGGARYFAYDQETMSDPSATSGAYRRVGEEPDIWKLMPNDLATLYGIDTIQGYNPSVSRRFAEYVKVMNGFAQEYHEANVFPSGLASPLLDALGAKFMVIDATDDPKSAVDGAGQRVYDDGSVMVIERSNAFPRAWLVNQVVVATPGDAAATMAADQLDYRMTAVVETPMEITGNGLTTTRELPRYEPAGNQAFRVDLPPGASGLLVVGQSYDPGWTVEVDGVPGIVQPVHEALTGVQIPAGARRVAFRYDPPSIRIGGVLSLAGAIGLAVLMFVGRSGAVGRPAPNGRVVQRRA